MNHRLIQTSIMMVATLTHSTPTGDIESPLVLEDEARHIKDRITY